MRTVKKNGHTVLVLKAHRESEFNWNRELTLAVFKIGRHVFVTDGDAAGALDTLSGTWLDDDPDPKKILGSAKDDALLYAGPKTLVRLLSEAVGLKGVSVNATHSDAIHSSYADYERTWSFRKGDDHSRFRLHREGARVLFKAPCGATGYISLRDAEKLIEAIPSL